MAEQPKARRRNTREELIKAGVEEINRYGVAGFSMRRIAQLCGVSCGAPYKHFGDRKEFIAAIIDDVNAQWHARQAELLAAYEGHAAHTDIDSSHLEPAGVFHAGDNGLLYLSGHLRNGSTIADLNGYIDGNIIRLPKNRNSFGELFPAKELFTHRPAGKTCHPFHLQGGGASNHFQDLFGDIDVPVRLTAGVVFSAFTHYCSPPLWKRIGSEDPILRCQEWQDSIYCKVQYIISLDGEQVPLSDPWKNQA